MNSDVSFELEMEKARREVCGCYDLEHLRSLTLQMIDVVRFQRKVTRDLLLQGARAIKADQ